MFTSMLSLLELKIPRFEYNPYSHRSGLQIAKWNEVLKSS